MDKAFDVVFQTEVEAEKIAKSSYHSIGDRFRYQCLCCGEEVYLAAADSIVKSPHFRHRRGNNDTDCESYLGQPGAIERFVSIRKRNKEHIGFGFNIDHMTFEFSLRFDLDEIERYAMEAKRLALYSKYNIQPFFSIPINRGNLIPDIANYFTLNDYSNDYYVSFDLGVTKVKYSDVIKREGILNIYRISKSDCHCKHNTSDIIYTNSSYLAVSENEGYIKELAGFQNIEVDGIVFSFDTQGRRFYAVKFKINSADYSLRLFLQKHSLKVEISESFSVLWPPVYMRDELAVSEAEKVYVSSSFELLPHGNVDSNIINIQNAGDGVYGISYEDRVTIYEKNVECRIIKEKIRISEEECEGTRIIYTDKFVVPDVYDYYLFDKNGCARLVMGSKIYLSGTDRIVGYRNGHIKETILPDKEKAINKKQLIDDIVKYHPQSESFEPDDFMDIEADETVLSYIENCYRIGQINTVVKQYIKEGLI